jgi:hypothetical protein
MKNMTIILIVVPGIIASAYYCRVKKISVKSIDFFINAAIFAFLINIFVFNVAYLRGHKVVLSAEMFLILGNAARYGILALIAALALPNIFIFFDKLLEGRNK